MATLGLESGLLNHNEDNSCLLRRCSASWKSRFVWLASAATSIVTTKYLLAGELNYPLHLLLIQLLILTAFCFFRDGDKFAGESCLAAPDGITALLRMAYHLSMCASYILAYLSIYHFSNLPVALFVLTLDWQPATLFSRIRTNQASTTDLLRYAVFACGLTFIFVYDYRLHSSVRSVALTFLATIGCAELCLSLFQNPELLSQGLTRRPFSPLSKVLPACMLIPIGVLAFHTEYWRPTTWIPLAPTGIVLAINAISTAVAVTSGGFVLRHIKLPEPSTTDIEPTESCLESIVLSATFTGVVSFISALVLDQPAVLSVWQVLGYAIATLAFVTTKDLDDMMNSAGLSGPKDESYVDLTTKALDDSAIELLPPEDDPDQGDVTQRPCNRRSVLCLLLLGGLSWLAFLRIWYNEAPPPPEFTKASLDQAFHPRADFDIVVARYDESPTDIAEHLNLLLQAPRFQSLQTRVHFYNKNIDTTSFTEDIERAMTGFNISVTPSENIGRESDAYLHHITSNWDDLAAHTLFMQAEPHDFKLARHQISEYLIPETGFMPLAYEGAICRSCAHCHDHSWSENPAVLSALYTNANSGAACKDLVLTYRGQFLVSAARIRGNEKAMYADLLDELRNPNSSMHSVAYTPTQWNADHVDSLNAPTFGFTLERLWGVLMQCSDTRLAYWTPSLLGAYARPSWLGGAFAMEDVQCLDRPVGA